MIKEFQAFITLFKQGKEVANPEFWKNAQVKANLAALIGAIALISAGFGYDIHLNDATVSAASGGIVAFYTIGNSVLTLITSKKVGIKAKA